MSVSMSQDQARFHVQVQPNAKKDEIVHLEGNSLKVKISAQPVKGKANKSLIEFLSKVFKIRKSAINIEKGLTSKKKTILIEGITQAQILERLNETIIRD